MIIFNLDILRIQIPSFFLLINTYGFRNVSFFKDFKTSVSTKKTSFKHARVVVVVFFLMIIQLLKLYNVLNFVSFEALKSIDVFPFKINDTSNF